MQRRSERLLNHHPSFRHFEHDTDENARRRDAERKRNSRAEESSIERNSRQRLDAARSAASRQDADVDSRLRDVYAQDAKRYAAQMEKTCIFYMCCVCAYEGGENELFVLSEEIKDQLCSSPLASKFRALMSGSSPFVRCVASELKSPGILCGVDRICKFCFQDAKAKKLPSKALVCGFFCGKVPEQLANLNTIEVSMVALINPTTKVELIKGGMHSTVNSLSYTNDVIDIAKKLPNLEGSAILRDRSARSHNFRPKLVREALLWLKENNKLYSDVVLEFPPEWNVSRDEPVDATTLAFDSETMQPVIDTEEMSSEQNPTNSGAIAPVHAYVVNYHQATSSMSILQEIALSASIAGEPSGDLMQYHAQPIAAVASSESAGPSIRTSVVVDRRDGEKVEPHKVRSFDAMAFPQLYPYGEGADHNLDASYISHRLKCGGNYRRFAENLTWLFTHYGYDVRKKNGGISALSEKIINSNDAISKADAEDLMNFLRNNGSTDAAKLARIRQLLTYVAPFANSIPGSQVYMQQERNKMRSFVNSPLTCTDAHWRWFYTAAQSDLFNPVIYDNLVAAASSVNYSDARTNVADALSKDTRVHMVRQNPVIPVRLWNLQQDAFFAHIINGSAKPLGGEVVDWTDKYEFQGKGTSHTHSLLCVKDSYDDSYFNDINAMTESKMREIVDKAVTATLSQSEDIVDFSWDWTPSKRFEDTREPQRRRFNPDQDYSWDYRSNCPTSAVVGLQMQELQISAYMHDCQTSCFKYCMHKPRKFWSCRHEYPVKHDVHFNDGTSFCHESNCAQVLVDRDRKNRPRIRVLPDRNNANIAPSPKSPLFTLAAGANTNLQFLSNKYGAVEYTTGYLGKVDLPDTKIVINTIIKLLSIGDQRHQNVLKAILNGMSNGRHVCANEAAFYFLDNKIVKYSRPIKSVNPRPVQSVNMNVDLNGVEDDVDNGDNGLKETQQHSTRKYYALFVRKQLQMHGCCNVSFYSFLTSFSGDNRSGSQPQKYIAVPLFEINDQTGVVSNAVSFECCNCRFIAHRPNKTAVIHYRPFFNVNEADEMSCACLLLMYIPWPDGLEERLIDEGDNAVNTWHRMKHEGMISTFATHFIGREIHRQGLTVGQPEANAGTELRSRDDTRREDDNDFEAFYDNEHVREVVPSYDNSMIINGNGVEFNVDEAKMGRAKTHIDRLKEAFNHDFKSTYGLSDAERALKLQDSNCVIAVAHHMEQDQLLQVLEASLVTEQRFVYHHIVEHILDTTKGQLVSFVTGEGGTGKSRIISALKLWSNVVFGKQEGTLGACVLCAPTGPAAFNIKGDTWQSVFGHSVEKGNISSIEGIKNGTSLRNKFKGVKMIVFDEVSMIGAKAMWEIHLRLQVACDDDFRSKQMFGGFHVLFFGDFYQLPPTLDVSLTRDPSDLHSKEKFNDMHSVQLFRTSINFFFELKYNFRAQVQAGQAPNQFAQSLSHMRLGLLNDDNCMYLSTLFCSHSHCMTRPISDKELWLFATRNNVKKHNKACFERLRDSGKFGIRIVAKHFRSVSNQGRKDVEWANAATEKRLLAAQLDERKNEKQHMAYLDICVGSRVRCSENLLVSAGLTNGAQGTVVGFLFAQQLPDDFISFPDNLSADSTTREIPVVLVEFDYNDKDPEAVAFAMRNTFITNVPNVFPICATKMVGSSNIPLEMDDGIERWTRFQLPLLPGHARTGHSSQGLTAHNGVIVSDLDCKMFAYVYVAISRSTSGALTRLLAPFGGINMFDRNYAQPNAKIRSDIDALYHFFRESFPQQ